MSSNREAEISRPPRTQKDDEFRPRIIWPKLINILFIHVIFVASLFHLKTVKWETLLFTLISGIYGNLGVTAGSHRLWSHRSYQASLHLRIFLAIGHLLTVENPIIEFCQLHRVHHKFSETHADPHNAKRGFFFAHIGWHFLEPHPEYITSKAKVDLSDVMRDPVVMFQNSFYSFLVVVFAFALPTMIPWICWSECLWVAFLMTGLRAGIGIHASGLVNSVAHMWGSRPYDVTISPTDNPLVSAVTGGEGFHNYHHTFPQDYSASEWRYSLNITTLFIDVMVFCGLAHGRKSTSKESVLKRMERTGGENWLQ